MHVDSIVTIAGLVSAAIVLLRAGRNLARIAARVDEALPVLLDIAESFRAPTLAAQLAEIKDAQKAAATKLDELHDYSHGWRHQLSGAMTKVLLKLDLDVGDLDDGGPEGRR